MGGGEGDWVVGGGGGEWEVAETKSRGDVIRKRKKEEGKRGVDNTGVPRTLSFSTDGIPFSGSSNSFSSSHPPTPAPPLCVCVCSSRPLMSIFWSHGVSHSFCRAKDPWGRGRVVCEGWGYV